MKAPRRPEKKEKTMIKAGPAALQTLYITQGDEGPEGSGSFSSHLAPLCCGWVGT